jgi:hypothetical protein
MLSLYDGSILNDMHMPFHGTVHGTVNFLNIDGKGKIHT